MHPDAYTGCPRKMHLILKLSFDAVNTLMSKILVCAISPALVNGANHFSLVEAMQDIFMMLTVIPSAKTFADYEAKCILFYYCLNLFLR